LPNLSLIALSLTMIINNKMLYLNYKTHGRGKTMSTKVFNGEIKQKNLSVISFCLFSAWNLSFLFEGQVLYSIIDSAQIDGTAMIKAAVLTVFIGCLPAVF